MDACLCLVQRWSVADASAVLAAEVDVELAKP